MFSVAIRLAAILAQHWSSGWGQQLLRTCTSTGPDGVQGCGCRCWPGRHGEEVIDWCGSPGASQRPELTTRPLCRALDDAERQVLARREALREAEVTAKEAEAR